VHTLRTRAAVGASLIAGACAAAGAIAPAAAVAAHPTVTAALQRLQRSGAIGAAEYAQYRSTYVAAKRSLGKLGGTRREELGAVISNVQAIAAAGGFTASRLPALFLTLRRNREWWTTQSLLSNGVRLGFPGSKLVWQYYAGQGIEIQWLGTFGEANGYYLSGHENANLRQLLGEALPLATHRAGGIAWEYLFEFDGGRPPWTSGLSQGTALQVFARAWSRFKDPAYLTAAQQALGVFQASPPRGVRVRTNAGAHYAEYTYAPSDRILNGFIQALVGLYDYASITRDPLGQTLFEAGDAEARAELPHYDTGAWSRYDQFSESTLSYHELLTEFLQHLCSRTRKGPPIPPPTLPPPTTTGTGTTSTGTAGGTGTSTTAGTGPGGSSGTGTTSGTSTGGSSGTGTTSGTSTGSGTTTASVPPMPIAADAVYCTAAQRFTVDERTPPVIALLTTRLRGGVRAGVMVSLSKVSSVGMTIRQGGHIVWTNRAMVEGGRPRLLWVTPRSGGTFNVTLSATDEAGNFSTANGTITVEHG
jgi:D-glucuronyl C5-epimerase C-terminus